MKDPINPSLSSPPLSNSISSTTNFEIKDDIRNSTHLNFTMTIQSKPHKQPVYRVKQRPDGVIVEKPRYRHSSYAPAFHSSEPVFEKKSLVIDLPRRETRSKLSNKDRGMYDELRGISAFVDGDGGVRLARRDGCNEIFQMGRSGYNGVFDRRVKKSFVKEVDVADPMQRFLGDVGPWSTESRRGGGVSA
jgi:hypothetical protein